MYKKTQLHRVSHDRKNKLCNLAYTYLLFFKHYNIYIILIIIWLIFIILGYLSLLCFKVGAIYYLIDRMYQYL